MSEKTKLGLGDDTVGDVATGDTLGQGTLATVSGSDTSAGPADRKRGEDLGRFVVLGVLGSGGMGMVYSAYDPQLDRKVAIKLLHARPAASAADAQARLLREAQAMAKIDHPNVVKVHEVGMLDERVYVAMEFAEGGTLRDWLKQRRSTAQIIDKLAQAGRGLAAAHAAGLIHRDFKPDNVLLAKDGSVRVTDFGLVSIAPSSDPAVSTLDGVAVAPADALISVDLTRTGSIMGTPGYMAPEQFAGSATSERTDQFAFCVALYEALYGERPFRGATFHELAANVTTGQMAPLPKHHDVPGWLRRVVMRGLSPSADDRFSSMTALLSHIERDDARRRKRIVGVAGAAAVATGIATAYVLWPQPGGACRAGDDRVDQIWGPAQRDKVKTAFAASHRPHAAASFDRVAKLLDDWGRGWALAYADACEDSRVRGEQSDHMLDLRMQCLTRRLEETRATVDLLANGQGAVVDHAVEAALHLPTIEPCADTVSLSVALAPPDTQVLRAKVDAVREKVGEAHAMFDLGQYKPARDVASGAVLNARTTEYRPVIGEALKTLGEIQLALAEPEAISTLQEAMHTAAAAGDQLTQLRSTAMLLKAYVARRPQYEVGLELSELADAIAIHAHPGPEILIQLGAGRAEIDHARGQLEAARTGFERTLALAEKSFGDDSLEVSGVLDRLADVLKTEGKYHEAEALLERALKIDQHLYGNTQPQIAPAMSNLGNMYRIDGKLDDAKRLYDQALAIRIAALGPEHPDVATSYNSLGSFYAESGHDHDAELNYRRALALWEKASGPDSIDSAIALVNLASSLVNQEKYVEARSALVRARKIVDTHEGSPMLVTIVEQLAMIDGAEDKLDAALTGIHEAETIATKLLGADHPDMADCLANEATLLKRMKRYAEAKDVDERVVMAFRKIYGPDHVRVGMALNNLADVMNELDDLKGTVATAQQALAIFEARLGKDNLYLAYPLIEISDALIHLGRAREAVPYAERALAIRVKGGAPPEVLAQAHFTLGEALGATPATRAHGIAEVTTARDIWQKTDSSENVASARDWLAKHR